MQNFLSLGYMLHILLSVSANFPDNPRIPCDCLLSFNHILIDCIDTADIRKQLFNCNDIRRLLNSVAGGTIYAYLSEIN